MTKTFPLFCFIVFMFSCDLQREFEVKMPSEKQRIVANCIFAADSIWEVRIYHSQDILTIEDDHDNGIPNVLVTIVDGSDQIPLTRDQHDITEYHSTQRSFAGKTYNLKVSAPGYETTLATVTVPGPVGILGVETARSIDPENHDDYKRTFRVQFKDPGHELNYYAFGMTLVAYDSVSDDYIYSPVSLSPLDPTFSKNYYNENFEDNLFFQQSNLLFDDRLFDGDTYTLSVSCLENKPDDTLREEAAFYLITLRTLSPEYYNYRVTYNLQQDAKHDPFAQPVQVFNNIKNGYGIFAAFSQSYYKLKVK
jgi:hypothetical protein